MTGRRAAWVSLVILLSSSQLGAQPPAFRVDTEAQREPGEPVVAALETGGFVVVWKEKRAGDREAQIVARLFRGPGQPEGEGELPLSSPGDVSQPAVAGLAGGGFVVVWKDPEGIAAQTFETKSAPNPQPSMVTDFHSGGFDVAGDGAGGFIVVWEDIPGSSSGLGTAPSVPSLKIRSFDQAGSSRPGDPQTLAVGLDGDAAGDSVPPRLARTEEGDLIAVWQQGGTTGDVVMRTVAHDWKTSFSPVLSPVGGAKGPTVNLTRAGLQRRPAVAARHLDNLRVVWESGPPDAQVDLALCVNGSQNTGASELGPDTLLLQRQAIAAALEDSRVFPVDGSLRLEVLQYGGAIETSLDWSEVGPTSVQGLAARFSGDGFARTPGVGTVAPCLGAAVESFSGLGPAAAVRKVVLLASDAFPTDLHTLPVSPQVFETNAGALTAELRAAADAARTAGVTTVSAARIPISGGEREQAREAGADPAVVPRVDLAAGVFPALPESGRGVVSEAADAQALTRALGRTLAAELGAESGIFARIYLPGASLAPEVQLNTSIAGDQSAPDIAMDSAGRSLVVWEDRELGRIEAQFLGANGKPVGAQLDVSDPGGSPLHPRVAALGHGRFVVVWEQSTLGRREVLARLLGPAPRALGTGR